MVGAGTGAAMTPDGRRYPTRSWDRLDQIPAGMEALTAGHSLYLSWPWLAFVEDDPGARVRYHGVLVRGRPLGLLATYRQLDERNPDYRLDQIADGRWAGQDLFLGGSRRAYRNELLIDRGLATADRDAVLDSLLASGRREAAAYGAQGLALLYVSTADARQLARVAGRTPVLADAEARIRCPGADFADYLATLRSHRRVAIRHERAAFRAAGHRVAIEPLVGNEAVAAALLAQLQDRHGNPAPHDRWLEPLCRLGRRLGDRAFLVTARSATQLVGYCLLIRWADTLYARLAGFDYARVGAAFEYFNLVVYEPVALAYRLGLRYLHLGRGALAAKRLRGADLAALWMVDVTDRPERADSRAYNATVAQRLTQRAGAPVGDLDLVPEWVGGR
jgi:hypothetical protein